MKIYLIAGEKSGDQHAAKIVKELTKDKNVEIRGWGGDNLKSQGMHLHYEIRTQSKSVDPVPFLKAGHEISLSGQLPSHLNL